MLQSIFATKLGMTQAWDSKGHRLAVTKCKVTPNVIVEKQNLKNQDEANQPMYIIGFGKKKLKNMTKPLKNKLEKSGFSFGVSCMEGILATSQEELNPGQVISVNQVLKVGDVVNVKAISKGRGFAGAMKRHGFHGGPRTHGQSDRARAVGSIGAGTTPGRVYKGKKMPGHYGVETKTIRNLVVIHIDAETGEVWLNGPVPGYKSADIRISPNGETKEIKLDLKASGIQLKEEKTAETEKVEEVEEKKEA